MHSIPQYDFYKTKYGEELLIDIVPMDYIKKYIKTDPVHTLSYFDITFIEEGNGFFSVNDKHYRVNPGDVVFSIPGEIRTWDKDHIQKGYALIFEEEFLLSFFNDPLFLQNLAYFHPRRISAKINISNIQTRIDSLIQHIVTEVNGYTSKDKHVLRALLYEMLMLLNREYLKLNDLYDEKSKTISRHIPSFTNLVHQNFKNQHSTKFYADQLCITPNYLNEIVQKTMGVNVKLYIQNKVILEAKKQLTYTSMSISEIAEYLSFDNPSYFIRWFRRQTNFTPLQYRNHTKR